MHRIFIRHIAQNFLTYVSMPAKFMCNLPNKSTAHLDDIGFFRDALIEILHKIFRCKSVVLNKEQILSLAIDIFGHNVYYYNIKPIKQIGLV